MSNKQTYNVYVGTKKDILCVQTYAYNHDHALKKVQGIINNDDYTFEVKLKRK
tara:strand:+ start:1711 stop:1869 length:159 start_codon:yes stop_codon:yes gene_type:complete